MTETAELLDEVRAFVATYCKLPGDEYLDAVALWVLHAHAIKAAETSPRLVMKSPEKESGKTRVLEVLEVLVPAPLPVMNATVPAIFRLIASEGATVLFDEVDAIFAPKAAREHEDLRGLLNAGYRRGATVARVVGEGKRMRVERFPVFAATALASIDALPDTIESRSVIIPMRRRAPDEEVQPFRRRKVAPAAELLRDQLAQWAEDHEEVLTEAEPDMPVGVTDRAADIWEPLVAIADLAGEPWADLARTAVTAIVASRVDDDQSIGVRLLADVQRILPERDKMSSQALAAYLNGLEESGWGGWHDGKGLNPRDLARHLGRYGIKPTDVKIDGNALKGYRLDDFEDAWKRYLRDQGDRPQPDLSSGSRSRGGRGQVGQTDKPGGNGRGPDMSEGARAALARLQAVGPTGWTVRRTKADPWPAFDELERLGLAKQVYANNGSERWQVVEVGT
jgi:Protein of unknown function (DUF3631)